MSTARTMRREATRQQAKATTIPTVRTHPKDVVKSLQAERKKEARLHALINRIWGADDWDMAWVGEGEVG